MQIDEKADAWLEDERTSTLYQVIGSLAEAAGVFDDPHVIRALDLAAYGKTQDGGDVLPFCPAYESAKQKGEAEGWRPISDEPLEALAHARTTAANDDISNERERHCQRIAAMQSASEEIVKLRAILALIRPAFEAVAADRDAWKAEKQRETNRAMAEINALHAEADRLAAARDAAEAKLADCAVYLKDGETPRQRMDRDHADVLGLIKLLEQEKRRTEAAEAKLAQAVEDEHNRCWVHVTSAMANETQAAQRRVLDAFRRSAAARGEKT